MFRSKRRPVVFPQADHAVFAGQLAALWGNDDFASPPLPRDSFVRGVAVHDRGYGELETDAIGGMSDERWLEIQRQGFGVRDDDPIVDLVASMHIRRLVRGAEPAMEEALPALRERAQVDVADACAADEITDLCDTISFDVCMGAPERGSVAIGGRDVAYGYDGERSVTVSPWPFEPRRFTLLLVGYHADGYPERLERVVEQIAFAPG